MHLLARKLQALCCSCLIPVSFRNQSNQYTSVRMTWKWSLSFPHPGFFLSLRMLNTKRLTRLTASADTDPPPGVPDIHGHQLSSIRAVKYHISVYKTKSQILCACKQKVRCHVPMNKQSGGMYLWTKSQMSRTCEQTVR